MNFLKNYLFILLASVFLFACTEKSEEKAAELLQRDSILSEKEKQFVERELEYQQLLRLRDSIQTVPDTTQIAALPFDISGKWNGKVVCIESNCSDYVVGDTRVDEWEITTEGNDVIMRNINKVGVIRLYSGVYDGNSIKMTSQSEPEAEKERLFSVDLNTLRDKRLSGTREVRVDNACLSKFSIELTR